MFCLQNCLFVYVFSLQSPENLNKLAYIGSLRDSLKSLIIGPSLLAVDVNFKPRNTLRQILCVSKDPAQEISGMVYQMKCGVGEEDVIVHILVSEKLPEHSRTRPQNTVETQSNIFRSVSAHSLSRKTTPPDLHAQY